MPTKTDNGKTLSDVVDEGLGGVGRQELELALLTFQQTNFQEWTAKMLAANFQRRLDIALKAMPDE